MGLTQTVQRRYKAVVVYPDPETRNLVSVAESVIQHVLQTKEHIPVKDLVYSSECKVYVALFEISKELKEHG